MDYPRAALLLQAALRLIELAARAVERSGDVSVEEMREALARARVARERWESERTEASDE